jgi:predicted permease
VANLLLLRALGRKREIAVRLALGVSRRRLAAQFMSEGLLVAALGGGVALAITFWGSAALRGSILPTVQWGSDGITVRVIAFVMGTTFLAAILAGVVPATQSGSPELTTALRGGAREGRTTRGRMRTTLLIVQAALSVVLLAGAGLFVMSLRHVEAIDIGYDSDRLIFATAERAPEDTISDERITAMLPAIAERLRHIPDVEQVALTRNLPMYSFSFEKIFLPGMDSLPSTGAFGFPIISAVSPEYFPTTGIAIRRGRRFTASDHSGTELVVVINETMARTYWPKGDALGSCVMLVERTAPCRRVVGIAADAHIGHVIEEASPQYYVPLAQAPEDRGEANAIMIRARSNRTSIAAAAVMREMRSELGSFATPDVRLMDTWLAREFHQWKLGAALFSVAGLLALLVAAVGIYSTVAYMVGQRTHEIGVRIALGARSANIVRVVLGRGIGIVVAGIAVGLLATLAMGKLVASLLYGVSPRDPVVLGIVALVLLVAAVAACLVPALRAARVDPMETLRAE